MIRVIATERIPIKMWLENISEETMKQAKNLANLPFAFHHIALMPDAHEGYGMPIGGVMAAEGVIVPNAVGKDIGCGMCASRTDLTHIDKKTLKKIMASIRKLVPVGFRHHEHRQDESWMPTGFDKDAMTIVKQEYASALHQVGTLGSGNHFMEIQKGDDGYIWIMVHSGSRNIGKKVADHYDRIAIQKNQEWYAVVDKSWQLAFLPVNTRMAQIYLDEMNYCIAFAYANRQHMIHNIQQCMREEIGDITFTEPINIAHNYANKEVHFGKEVYIHRKGATSAQKGQKGIIPGSQGSRSYIVEGLGNPESFMSCSHGAGRKMGRKQAQRELILADEIAQLDEMGVIHAVRGKYSLDEAPGAYKDIDMVMENQKDLVKILIELKPLAVIKG